MKKCLLLLCFLVIFGLSHSQTYSYAFEGQLNTEQMNALELKCNEHPTIESSKVYYKEDYQKGEIIIRVANRGSIETEEQFNPVTIKSLLLEYQLTPQQYRKLND